MSRKKNLVDIVNRFEEQLVAHEKNVEEVQRNRELSEEGKARRFLELRVGLRAQAERCRVDGMAVMSEARADLERRIQDRPADYQLQLANALAMAPMAKTLTPEAVKQLFTPFMYDEVAYSALAGTVRSVAGAEKAVAIPVTDLPRVRKYLDEIELYLQKRVDRLDVGSAAGVVADPVVKWSQSDMYTIFITRVSDRLSGDLTRLVSEDDDGAA